MFSYLTVSNLCNLSLYFYIFPYYGDKKKKKPKIRLEHGSQRNIGEKQINKITRYTTA